MNWIVAKIRWIMLVAGVLTCSMLCAVVVPDETVDFLFDRIPESSLAPIIVPSWGALVGLVGAMLIYGAFTPQVRTPVLNAASAYKLVFLGLMLARGRQYLDERVSWMIALDVAMVTVFILYMIGVRRARAAMPRTPLSQPAMSSMPPPRAEPRVQVPPRPPMVKSR